MYELMTSDDGGRAWTQHGGFTDLEQAMDAALEAWVCHEAAAVFEAGEMLHLWSVAGGRADDGLPSETVRS
jgi:hypothetical protein